MKDWKNEAQDLYLKGLSFTAIGQRLGKSRQRVTQVLACPRAIRRAVSAKTGGHCDHCLLLVEDAGHIHERGTIGDALDYFDNIEELCLLCYPCHLRAHRL